jgi:hypothetical protein
MSHFTRDGRLFSLFLTKNESEILINLVEQLLELLGEGDFYHHYDIADPLSQLLAMPEHIETPEDPVLLRLLPNAYSDPEAAADFRRYTEPAIRGRKQGALRKIRGELSIIVDEGKESSTIEEIDPDLWLRSLTDLRLALSVRLDVSAESIEQFELLPDEDRQKPMFAVYFWLGWLQENLLQLLT